MSLTFALSLKRGDFVLDFAHSSTAQVIALEGPSGAGKTTLLHGLAGLITSECTVLIVDGDPLIDTDAGLNPPAHRRRIGFAFQDLRLFPHLSVAANVAFGRRFAGPHAMPTTRALELLDLTALAQRHPTTLSGGEARRTALARALCSDPAILLLDEPFAGLDAARRDALLPYLLRLRDEVRLPMLLVSHDPRDADALAQDRVRIESGRRRRVD